MDGRIDALVIGAGTAGTFTGVARAVKKANPRALCVLVEPQGSIFGGGPPGEFKVEGIGLADCIGGYGVAEAAAACAQYKGWDLNGMRAVIQGFGSMGGSSARYLARLGSKIVGVADVNGTITNPDGLDVERLLASRSSFGETCRPWA